MNLTVQAATSDVYIYIHEGEQTTVYNYSEAYSELATQPNASIATAEVSAQSGTVQPVSAPNTTISLNDCLYTLESGSEVGTYRLSTIVNDTTVYLAPSSAPNGLPNYPNSVLPSNLTISRTFVEGGQTFDATEGYFYLRDSGYGSSVPRYIHFNSAKILFDRVTTLRNNPNFLTECKIQLYTPDETATSDIPGFASITSSDALSVGSQYIVLASAKDGNRYALQPSNSTSNAKTHLAMLLGKATKIDITGVHTGTTSLVLGSGSNATTYHITVLRSGAQDITLYTDQTPSQTTITNVDGTLNTMPDAAIVQYEIDNQTTIARGRTGTNASYNGNLIDLDNCLYTFQASTVDNITTYKIFANAGDTPIYLAPHLNGKPTIPQFELTSSTATATTVSILNSPVQNSVYFKNITGYLFFHRDSKRYFNQHTDVSKTSTSCSFLLYRKATSGETSSTEIPGYVQLQSDDMKSAIQNEEKYLIVAKANNDYYVLRPNTNTTQPYSHIAKVTILTNQDITFTALNPGNTHMNVGESDFNISIHCNISLDAKGGNLATIDAVRDVTIGTQLALPAVTKEGYNFLGWFTQPDNGIYVPQDYQFDTTLYNNLDSNHKLYAHWEVAATESEPTHPDTNDDVTITLLPNGGSITNDTFTIKQGITQDIEVPTRTGYTFVSWNTWTNTALVQNRITNYDYVTHGTALVANWTPKPAALTLNANGGSVSSTSVTGLFDGSIGTIPTPTRTGYAFDGWFDSAVGGNTFTDTTFTAENRTVYAHWTAKDATLTFDANGGSVTPASVSGLFDGSIGTIPTPTRTGYTFDGWFDSAVGGITFADTTFTFENKTIYAHWTAKDATLTFDANGGSVTPASVTGLFDGSIGTIPTPTRTGYAFDGWFDAATGGNTFTDTTFTFENKTIYAHWSPKPATLTFDANGGSVTPASVSGSFDGNIGTIPTPTRTGYTFDGWFDSVVDGNTFAETTFTAESKTIYAHWRPNNATLTLDANGGTITPSSVSGVFDGNIGIIPTPTRTGYTFEGWFDSAVNGNAFAETTFTFENKTIYAHWRPNNATLTLKKNDGTNSFTSMTGTFDGPIGTISTPTRTGYIFSGWYLAAINGTPFTDTTFTAEDRTIYAHWTAKDATLTLDANGGSVTPTSVSGVFDGNIGTIPTPTRTGYTFDGWFDSAVGGNAFTDTTFTAENRTVYAHWTAKDATLTFDANGGSVTPASVSGSFDGNIGTIPTPTRTGYAFDGWFDAATGGNTFTDTTFTFENKTIYAHWTAKDATLTFDANGGSVTPANVSGSFDGNIGTIPTPTRTGYTFDGWFDSAVGGNAFTDTTFTAENRTIYAHWSPKPATLTFDANGGSVTPASVSGSFDGNIGTIPTPTRTGYTFDGWFDSAVGGNAFTDTTFTAENRTIYAHWTAKDATLTFDANGGSVTPASVSGVFDGNIGIIPTPTRTGYTFDGWFDSAVDGNAFADTTFTAENRTVYAHWSPKPATLTFDANGGSVTPANVSGSFDGNIGTIPTPARTGYTFDGWFDSAVGGNAFADTTFTAENRTVYAHWSPKPATLTLMKNDGTDSSSTIIGTFGNPIGTISTPTRSGYIFSGWYSAAMNGEHFTDTIFTFEKKTIYAHWTAKQRRLTLHFNDENTQNVYIDGNIEDTVDLPTPSREGYTFDGWFDKPVGGTKITEINSEMENVALYAHWTQLGSGSETTSASETQPAPTTKPTTEPTTKNPSSQTTTEPTTKNPSSQTTTESTTKKPLPQTSAEPTTTKPLPQTTAEPVTKKPLPQTTAEPTTTTPLPQTSAEPVTKKPLPQTSAEPTTKNSLPQTTAEPTTTTPLPQTSVEPVTKKPLPQTSAEPTTKKPLPQTTAEPTTKKTSPETSAEPTTKASTKTQPATVPAQVQTTTDTSLPITTEYTYNPLSLEAENSNEEHGKHAPKTGDSLPIGIMILLLFSSLISFVLLAITSRKEHR